MIGPGSDNNRLAQEKSDVSPFLSFDTRMGQIAKFIQFVQIQGFPWNSTATFVTTMKMLRKVIIASKSITKNIQKTLWFWKWQKRKRSIAAKIWAKENCWRLCIRREEACLLRPRGAERCRKRGFGQESGDSYCSSITVFFFCKKREKISEKSHGGFVLQTDWLKD